MLCRKQQAEIGLDASKIMILMLKIDRNAPEELEALLHEDSCQTLPEHAQSLGVDHITVLKRLRESEMIQEQCHWMPCQLKPRDNERRLFTCEQLLQRQKREGFLNSIVTDDEKWIHYDTPKSRKSCGKSGHVSTSSAKSNIHSFKLLLIIWWDQLGAVYYEQLKPKETITGDRYRF
ncbi:Mariner Mos1 transposase [Araneus ventricosus]|uniref:Mariner Mos1 transposase n=1 Tax=Araneus ventricosus TaxID=182803 RepID=A0A4Y2HQ01_ARAVE|nr:Mariner Mos1 transposase [Araneus ventricosus]